MASQTQWADGRMDAAETERFVNHLTSAQAVLYAYITSLLGDRESAKDVLQETNLVLWRKSAEFDEHKSFAAWSSGIAPTSSRPPCAARHRASGATTRASAGAARSTRSAVGGEAWLTTTASLLRGVARG